VQSRFDVSTILQQTSSTYVIMRNFKLRAFLQNVLSLDGICPDTN